MEKPNIGLISVSEIIAGLSYKNVCAWWMPLKLMPKMKRERLKASG